MTEKEIQRLLKTLSSQNKKLIRQENYLIEQQRRMLQPVQQIEERRKFIKDGVWPSIYASVNKIFPRFYIDIVQKYPWMTERDTQLCILMKLAFTTAEIAEFTAVSIAAVTKRKQRIKERILENASCEMCAKYISLDSIIGGL